MAMVSTRMAVMTKVSICMTEFAMVSTRLAVMTMVSICMAELAKVTRKLSEWVLSVYGDY